jgi:hypothetical protein
MISDFFNIFTDLFIPWNPEMKNYGMCKCPKCGLYRGVRIIYGFPPKEMILLEERGEIVFGGCCHYKDAPEWYCKSCDHKWKKKSLPFYMKNLH